MNVKLLTIILRLYSIVKLQEEDFSATNGKTGYGMLCIIKLRNFIKSYEYENTEHLRIVKLRNITKSYGRLHLRKIAYRDLTHRKIAKYFEKLRRITFT